MIKLLTRACVIAGLLAIVGCTTTSVTSTPPSPAPTTKPQVQPGQPAVVQPQPGAVPTPVPATPALNPAALSLAKQARSQYQAQDYQGAIATAERGLRIERRAAELYLVMAQSYIQLALPGKAKMFVQQGLRFAPAGSEVATGLLRAQEQVGN
jgi:hypothetical protein